MQILGFLFFFAGFAVAFAVMIASFRNNLDRISAALRGDGVQPDRFAAQASNVIIFRSPEPKPQAAHLPLAA